MNAPNGSTTPAWIRMGAALLGAVALAYLGLGFFYALSGEIPQDMHRRWVENAYFVRGVSSLDVAAGLRPVLPDIGPAHEGGYPPWSMAVGLLAVPPLPEELVRWYFAVLNVVALAVVVRFAFRVGSPYGVWAGRLLAASVLAISATAIVLRHGQYGILVNALLVFMLAALARDKPVAGGVWLALASLKPQSAGPFALAWLRRRGPIAWVVASVYALVVTACFSLWLDRSPLQLLSSGYSQAAAWERGDTGLLRLLLEAGVPRGLTIPGLMLLGLAAGALLLHRYRDHSVLARAAILAVVGRLWTYHRRYDDVMLMFLLLALGETALRRGDRTSWAAFFVTGATLWLPFRESDHGAALIALKVCTWVLALAWLLRCSAPTVPAPAKA